MFEILLHATLRDLIEWRQRIKAGQEGQEEPCVSYSSVCIRGMVLHTATRFNRTLDSLFAESFEADPLNINKGHASLSTL